MSSDTKAASRNIQYAEKTPSNTWLEEPCPQNPYIANAMYCHGYDLMSLAENKSFGEVIYLLIKGELPETEVLRLLEQLLVSFIMPGPRHPAARSAAAAGLGRTMTGNILPVALSVVSGERMGAEHVEQAMRFIVKSKRHEPQDISITEDNPIVGDLYGGRDSWADKLLDSLSNSAAASDCLAWLKAVQRELPADKGVFTTAVFAAAACDLGLRPAQGLLLFQLACAPGLAFHGLEYAGKALNAVPFVADDNYFFENDE